MLLHLTGRSATALPGKFGGAADEQRFCGKIQSANSPHQVAFPVGNMIRLLKGNHI